MRNDIDYQVPVTDILQTIINTLNDIEIKGEENMGKLLGVIYALKEIIKNNQSPQPVNEDGEVNG